MSDTIRARAGYDLGVSRHGGFAEVARVPCARTRSTGSRTEMSPNGTSSTYGADPPPTGTRF
jgi:hypothetical protein